MSSVNRATMGDVVYSEKELTENEEIVLNLRPHWWFFSKQILFVVVTLIVALVGVGLQLNSMFTALLFVPFLASLLWFGVRYLIWSTTRFVITTDRLIDRSGVLRRQGIEIPLERVNTVFFAQTLFERVIGSGDLEVESAGEQGRQKFANIRKPLNVQNEIYRQIEDNENRKFDRISPSASSDSSTATVVYKKPDTTDEFTLPSFSKQSGMSIPEQIEKLDELRIKRILTEEEFIKKKNELLDRM